MTSERPKLRCHTTDRPREQLLEFQRELRPRMDRTATSAPTAATLHHDTQTTDRSSAAAAPLRWVTEGAAGGCDRSRCAHTTHHTPLLALTLTSRGSCLKAATEGAATPTPSNQLTGATPAPIPHHDTRTPHAPFATLTTLTQQEHPKEQLTPMSQLRTHRSALQHWHTTAALSFTQVPARALSYDTAEPATQPLARSFASLTHSLAHQHWPMGARTGHTHRPVFSRGALHGLHSRAPLVHPLHACTHRDTRAVLSGAVTKATSTAPSFTHLACAHRHCATHSATPSLTQQPSGTRSVRYAHYAHTTAQ